jgi:hypothetical protein
MSYGIPWPLRSYQMYVTSVKHSQARHQVAPGYFSEQSYILVIESMRCHCVHGTPCITTQKVCILSDVVDSDVTKDRYVEDS